MSENYLANIHVGCSCTMHKICCTWANFV